MVLCQLFWIFLFTVAVSHQPVHTTFLLWLPHDMTTTLSPSGLELIIPHTNYQRLPSQNTTTIVFKSHGWLWNWTVELCSCWPTLVWWKHSSISPASTSEHLSHLYLAAPDSVLREIWNIILMILFFICLFCLFQILRDNPSWPDTWCFIRLRSTQTLPITSHSHYHFVFTTQSFTAVVLVLFIEIFTISLIHFFTKCAHYVHCWSLSPKLE